MKNNVGNTDRLIRFALGMILLIISFASNLTSGLLSYAVIVAGMALFATSMLSFCPLYALFKLNTTKI